MVQSLGVVLKMPKVLEVGLQMIQEPRVRDNLVSLKLVQPPKGTRPSCYSTKGSSQGYEIVFSCAIPNEYILKLL